MTQSVWTGTLRCGLLQLPVRLVPAVRDGSVHFEQRHLGCGGHVRREIRCTSDNALLAPPEMVRTIPLAGADYMEVPDAELERLEAMPSPVMQLHRTVPLDAVDPLFVAHHYLLLPRASGEPGYAALSAALVAEQCACVAQVVLRHRECTALVSPNAGGLLLSTLRASEDVIAYQALTDLAAGLPAVLEQELGLVRQLLRSLPSGLAYDELHDAYRERLLAFIGESGAGNPGPARIVDIDDLLVMAEAS